MNLLGEKYLRKSALPTIFCPGCGDGTIMGAAVHAIDELDIIDKVALVGGIGCSGWIPVFIDADVIHTLHGRAIPVATGLKVSDPDRKVLVFTGDGDNVGIGGNHFIHAARRNIDITVVMINNQIYGMTGGQTAPTTPFKAKTQTSPYGNHERSFDACQLAMAAKATFVARWTSAHPAQLAETIKKAILHRGFAFIEVLTQCPTQAGRYMMNTNNPSKLVDMLRGKTVPIQKYQDLKDEEKEVKVPIGVLHYEKGVPELSDTIYQLSREVAESV
ncbi:MAG TPA: 2-oxoacid:ferredoxin oxidoreductase subunit beta [Thermoanaerobacterales bacterium]|nr:2-oxoacid:ferredoxin oxidoreductase subunit beta [Thermoanaerobacterales bacterium]